jgi:hypothetical protein
MAKAATQAATAADEKDRAELTELITEMTKLLAEAKADLGKMVTENERQIAELKALAVADQTQTPQPQTAATATTASAVSLPGLPVGTGKITEVLKPLVSAWYPWLKFTVWIIVGLLVWQFIVFPVLSGKPITTPWSNSKNVAPNVDVNTPAGAAFQEMQNEPFRSDTVSRQTFGRIFDELNSLVTAGQITNLEGYYDAFGKRMQEAIPADRYGNWAGVWNKLATMSFRHGNVGTDVKAFNANLQSAAAVVAGRVSGFYNEYPAVPSPLRPMYDPAGYDSSPQTAPLPPLPTATQGWQYTPGQ